MKEKILTAKEAAKILEVDLPDNVRSMPFVFTTELDTTPQKLKMLRSYVRACAQIPSVLPTPAKSVLKLLMDCFTKQGVVQEGLIGDILWGFSQAECVMMNGKLVHLPAEHTYRGLCQLRDLGYIRFQAADGSYIGPESSMLESAWVRYEPKLLDMVYE